MNAQDTDHAIDTARACLEEIRRYVKCKREADAEDDEYREDIVDHINAHALELTMKKQDIVLLICTGGPAVRLVMFQNGKNELQHQNWFTPWEPLALAPGEANDLDDYAGEIRDLVADVGLEPDPDADEDDEGDACFECGEMLEDCGCEDEDE